MKVTFHIRVEVLRISSKKKGFQWEVSPDFRTLLIDQKCNHHVKCRNLWFARYHVETITRHKPSYVYGVRIPRYYQSS